MPRGGKGTIEAVTTPAYHAVCMCGQVVNGVMTFTACNFFELNGFGWELGVGLNFAVFQVSQAGRQAGWLASACTTDYHGMAWSARALLCDMTTDSCVDVPHRPSVCVLQGTLVMNFCNFFETNVATAMISVGEAFYVGGAYPPPPPPVVCVVHLSHLLPRLPPVQTAWACTRAWTSSSGRPCCSWSAPAHSPSPQVSRTTRAVRMPHWNVESHSRPLKRAGAPL